MSEVFKISIDWLTITMIPNDSHQDENGEELPRGRYADRYYNRDWRDTAEEYLADLINELDGFDTYFEDSQPKLAKLGYTEEKCLGTGINIGYHPNYEYMGICLQMTGDGLRELRSKNGDLAESKLLRDIRSFSEKINYNWRATRLDIAIDVENCRENVSHYRKLLVDEPDGLPAKGSVWRLTASRNGEGSKFEKTRSQTSVIYNENGYSVYVGSMQSNIRLNIYDKLREKKIEPTEELKSWVRFEGRFKKEYARDIANLIINQRDLQTQFALLYRIMYEKFQFRTQTEKVYRMSKKWEKLSQQEEVLLKADDKRDSDFLSAYNHVIEKSGLISLIAKAVGVFEKDIEKEKILDGMLKAIKENYLLYENTKDVNAFIEKHKNEDIKNLPWLDFIEK
ncbi:replication initiation factor domain-containing protein [Streptococcus uberis]|nr:replication initiation factor domain-containing protein [Streptococcus uberis]